MNVYEQVKENIIAKIENKAWTEGDKLPSEELLAKQYNISRGTVRQAIGQLVLEGILKREHGRGTFVKGFNREFNISSDFSTFINLFEHSGTSIDTELLETKIEKDNYCIKRLRKSGGNKVMLSINKLPFNLFCDIDKAYSGNDSIYDFLKNNYNIKISRIKRDFYADTADKEIANFLGIENKSAVFRVMQTSFDEFGRCIDKADIYIKGSFAHFSVETKF